MRKYHKNDEIDEQRIDDKIILFDTKSFRFYELNPTMTEIWDMLDKNPTMEDVVNDIVSKYDVDEETAKKDVEKSLNDMLDKNLINTK